MPIAEVLHRELTPDQREAAVDPASEVLCLACAGSGKSRTLAYRIAWLVAQNQAPSGIVAFTFTEKAADTIKLRVAKALEASELEPMVLGAMYIGTIHSYCYNILSAMDARYGQFEVLDENRLKLFLLSRRRELGLDHLREIRRGRTGRQRIGIFETIKEVSDAWKIINDEMVQIESVAEHHPELGGALSSLRLQLDQDEFIDFSLMIRLVVEALAREEQSALRAVGELRHLMVDEYQDVNFAQEMLIRELHRRARSLFVVGDDDQAIYAWRGADVNHILTFEERYQNASDPHTLNFNFRSTQPIVEAADGFVAAELGAMRYDKDPEATNPPGPRDFRRLWFNTRTEEAEWVATRIESLLGTAYREQDNEGTVRGLTPGDFAILMRSTRTDEQDGSQRHSAFTQALDARGILYRLEAGGGLFDRPQVSVLRDTFELLRNRSPGRRTALEYFNSQVLPVFPNANFNSFARVLADWGRRIHGPVEGPRRRVYPQQLVHDLLDVFGLAQADFGPDVMQDLGVFSSIMQDVETIYLSIDSVWRFQAILNFLQNVADTGYDTSTDEVERHPDLVTVSTVHKAKGLEFPVVFVVDVEAQRFPGNRRPYRGWLPSVVIQPALNRGAYLGTTEEEARLFYTAITRAERYLHVSGCERLPGGVQRRRPSRFSQRLTHEEIFDDPDGLPEGIEPHRSIPRIDETIVPTSYSDIRYYLRCPADYQLRKRFGFSPPIVEMFGYGTTVHTAVFKLHEIYQNRTPTVDEADDVARRIFHLKHVAPSQDPENRPGPYERAQDSAADILKDYVETYADDFTRRRQVEVRFEVPVEQAVISGSIDLMLHEDETGQILEASVIDFKAIEGGSEPEESEELVWTELALQVQLYAKAAREVLGENARTGAVHLLKDNQRVEVPVSDEAIDAAVENVEWAVGRILSGDFPMRPHGQKCESCDYGALCSKAAQEFTADSIPLPIHIPGAAGTQSARAFSEFEE